MLHRLGVDSIIYGGASLAVRGLQIFLIPIYSRVLGLDDYGVIETIAIAGALVNLTVALEISQGMARHIADTPDDLVRRAFASTAIGFAVFAYAAFFLIVAAFADGLAPWLLVGKTPPQTLVVAAAAIAVNGVFAIVQDLLRWQLRPWFYAMASFAYASGSAGVGIWLVELEGAGVVGVFWGQLAGASLGLGISLLCADGLLARVFDWRRLNTMLRFSLPLVLSGFAVFGNLFIDRIVVRELLGLEALGIYGVSTRFASVVSILAVGLQAAISPLVYRHWRDPDTAALLARVCRWYLVVMVALVGAISLFSKIIVGTLTGIAFHEGAAVLPLLALGTMVSTLYVFAPGLFLSGRTGHVALVNVVGILVNLFGAFIFIKWLGLLGAALAAALTPTFVMAGYLIMGRHLFVVP